MYRELIYRNISRKIMFGMIQ